MEEESSVGKYPIEFKYKFKLCGWHIPASSIEEADEMLEAIKQTGKVVGHPIQASIPADVPASGFLVKAYCAIRNLFQAN